MTAYLSDNVWAMFIASLNKKNSRANVHLKLALADVLAAECGDRDRRIAELEIMVAGFEAEGRVSFGDCSTEVQTRLAKLAAIEKLVLCGEYRALSPPQIAGERKD